MTGKRVVTFLTQKTDELADTTISKTTDYYILLLH